MNGIQNRKFHATEKQFPGCLGRMVNLFDLSSGITGNRLLTDKPHRDGRFLSHTFPHLFIFTFCIHTFCDFCSKCKLFSTI